MWSGIDQVRATASNARSHRGRGQVIAHVALDALPSLLGRAKRGETLCRLGANRTANGWNPAEHRAFRSQRHRRPAPKAEAVDMAHDQRVGKVEFGIDAV